MKLTTFRKWFLGYVGLMCLVFVFGALYWEYKQHLYWDCQSRADLAISCGLEPDGPLGAVLFVLLPFGASVVFLLVALVYYLKARARGKRT